MGQTASSMLRSAGHALMSALRLFKIRKEERWLAAGILVVLLAFCAMYATNKFDRFTMAQHVGFWSLFYNHLNMSGYDVFSCITVSCLRIHFDTLRHPLYIAILLPMYWLNSWLMQATGFNFTMFFILAVNLFCAFYAALFLYRTLREIVGVGKLDATLLTFMLYSFAHVLIATLVPDHFVLSLFLLTLTLYVTGRKMQRHEAMSPLLSGVLFLATAGMTLSNGVKAAIAVVFANGRKAFGWRYWAAVAVVLAIIATSLTLQQKCIIEPQNQRIAGIENALRKKDAHFDDQFKGHNAWVKKQEGKAMTEKLPLLEWSDMTTPRLRSVWDNLFGESLQLHRDHLLEDVLQTRPIFVSYRWTISYVVEALVIALFALGVWCGRRSRLMWLAMSWFGFDMLMHVVFGFGLNEVYIMTAHWAFAIPIAIAYTLRYADKHLATAARATALACTLWMWGYNGWILAGYLL